MEEGPKAVLLHGLGLRGSTAPAWMHNARRALEDHGFRVEMPSVPDSWIAHMPTWTNTTIDAINRLMGTLHTPKDLSSVHLCGHSTGALTVLKAAEMLPAGTRLGSITVVAAPYYDSEYRKRLDSFLNPPMFIDRIIQRTKNITVIGSLDDYKVLPDETRRWAKDLRADLVLVDKMKHFGVCDGVEENRFAVKAMLRHSEAIRERLKVVAKM